MGGTHTAWAFFRRRRGLGRPRDPVDEWPVLVCVRTTGKVIVQPMEEYDISRVVAVWWFTDGSGDDAADIPAPSWAFCVVVELDLAPQFHNALPACCGHDWRKHGTR